MRTLYALVLAGFLATSLALSSPSVAGNGSGSTLASGGKQLNPEAKWVAGHLIFKLEAGQNVTIMQGVLKTLQAGTAYKIYPRHTAPTQEQLVKGYVDLSRIYEVEFSAPYRMELALQLARGVKGVAYVEPRYIHEICYVTNDPRRSNQTGLTRVKAQDAWDVHKGDTNTVVGIVDSGVDWDHPDMIRNIAYNWADPIDNIDNDSDGYVDNFIGWDLGGADFNNVVGDRNPAMTAANNNHGSHVAGIAGATTDNGVGVAGSGFKCRVLPIKAAADNDTRGPGGVGYIIRGYEGITYGADHGCSVINCSWGGAGLSAYENDIINYATINKNALVVAAAGNSNSPADFFPACFNNVLNVAATNSTNDSRATFSNYNERISVSAPGNNVLSTIFNDNYGNNSGTSMAAPMVAGAAALLRSYDTTLTPAQVIAQIRASSDDIYNVSSNSGAQYLGKLGKGRLNMARMLTARTPGIALKNAALTDNNNNNFETGDTIRIKASFINRLFPSTTALTATFTTNSNFLDIVPNTERLTLGVLGGGDSTALATANEVLVVVLPGASVDAVENIRINFTDLNYTDFAVISLDINTSYVNFRHNNIASTVASNGRLGFAGEGQTNGLGVQLLNWGNLIYDMGLITAYRVGATTRLGSSVRGTSGAVNNDFDPITIVKAQPAVFADHEYAGNFDNLDLGLQFDHITYAWNGGADTGFYIYEYAMRNTRSTAAQNVFTGIFTDPDISPNGAADIVMWDSASRMGYVQSTDSAFSTNGGPFVGIALLSTSGGIQFTGIVNDGTGGSPFNLYDGFTDAEHYQSLSSGIERRRLPTTGRADVSLTAGYGPYTLQSGENVRLGYAVCVGYTLQDLKDAAARANVRYQQIVTSVSKNVENTLRVYPNPAQNTLYVSGVDIREVQVLDLRGAAVSTSDIPSSGGIIINIATLTKGMYLVRVRTAKGVELRRFVKE